MLRTPDPLMGPVIFTSTEGVLRILGRNGTMLILDGLSLEVRSWFWPYDLLRSKDRLEYCKSSLVGRYLWLIRGESRIIGDSCVIVDMDRARIERRFEGKHSRIGIVGGGEAAALLHWPGEPCRPHGVDGRRLPRPTVPSELFLSAACAHPSGEGLVLAHVDALPPSTGRVMVSALDGEGRLSPALTLDGASTAYSPGMAASRRAGLVFVLLVLRESRLDLLALRPSGGRLEIAYRVPVPDTCILATDSGGEQVALVGFSDSGPFVVLLGEEPPPRMGRRIWRHYGLPCLDAAYWLCGPRVHEPHRH